MIFWTCLRAVWSDTDQLKVSYVPYIWQCFTPEQLPQYRAKDSHCPIADQFLNAQLNSDGPSHFNRDEKNIYHNVGNIKILGSTEDLRLKLLTDARPGETGRFCVEAATDYLKLKLIWNEIMREQKKFSTNVCTTKLLDQKFVLHIHSVALYMLQSLDR